MSAKKAFVSLAPIPPDDPVFCLRFHPDGGDYGSAYSFSCLVTRTGTEGWLSMASGEFTPTVFREIKRKLKSEGFTRVRYERMNMPLRRLREIKG